MNEYMPIVIAIIGWIVLVLIYIFVELKHTRRVRAVVALFRDPKRVWGNPIIAWMVRRIGLTESDLATIDLTPLFRDHRKQVIQAAEAAAREQKWHNFSEHDLVVALYQLESGFHTLCDDAHIEYRDLQLISRWWHLEDEKHKEGFLMRFSRENPLGYSSLSGYTPLLDEFAQPAAAVYDTKRSHFHLSAHKQMLKQLQGILTQSGFNNALVVGESGTGKRALIFALTRLIERGIASRGLNVRRVMVLNMERLLAGITNQGQLRDRVGAVFAEAERAGNIALVIENMHEFVQVKNGLSTMSIAEIIIPFIRSQRLQLIALTTPEGLQDVIARDKQLHDSFVVLQIAEPTPEETMVILFDIIDDIERRSEDMVYFSYQSVRALVTLADQYISQGKRPQKVITLIDQLVSWLQTKPVRDGETNIITKSHIEQFLSERFGVAIGEGDKAVRDTLLNLEKLMKEDVVGQGVAITAIANALRRRQAALSSHAHTIGNFLFIGPTGVGKTSVAKALAKHYYKRDGAFIYMNMTEYGGPGAVQQLIGTRDEPSGALSNAVRENPFCLLLLDEIEKSSKEVRDLFLQILDEGRLINPRQDIVDFRHTIIIATSNAGAELIHDTVQGGDQREQFDSAAIKQRIMEHIVHEHLFSPEFLNRFDEVVLFQPLEKTQLHMIARMHLDAAATRILDEHDATVEFADDVIDAVVERGYTPEYGARELQRVIQDMVESVLAKMVLEDKLRKGSHLIMTRAMLAA